nr:copper resistance protein NlpE [uncultured Flavobacterium sp.]
MKKVYISLFLFSLALVSCKPKTTETPVIETQTDTVIVNDPIIDEHTSENSLDWDGTYQATLPCADCPGIKTNITLNTDKTFKITSEYLERDSKIEDAGEFMWHDNGRVVHLKGKETDIKLKVVENGLIHLNSDGTPITSSLKEHYRFTKL